MLNLAGPRKRAPQEGSNVQENGPGESSGTGTSEARARHMSSRRSGEPQSLFRSATTFLLAVVQLALICGIMMGLFKIWSLQTQVKDRGDAIRELKMQLQATKDDMRRSHLRRQLELDDDGDLAVYMKKNSEDLNNQVNKLKVELQDLLKSRGSLEQELSDVKQKLKAANVEKHNVQEQLRLAIEEHATKQIDKGVYRVLHRKGHLRHQQ